MIFSRWRSSGAADMRPSWNSAARIAVSIANAQSEPVHRIAWGIVDTAFHHALVRVGHAFPPGRHRGRRGAPPNGTSSTSVHSMTGALRRRALSFGGGPGRGMFRTSWGLGTRTHTEA